MILKFTTKIDINGNRYSIQIDTEKKMCQWDNNWIDSDFIIVKKRDLNKIRQHCIDNGFTEI